MTDRHVTEPSEPTYWNGRLAMAVAVAPRHPETARETLEAYLRHGGPPEKVVRMLKEEMRR